MFESKEHRNLLKCQGKSHIVLGVGLVGVVEVVDASCTVLERSIHAAQEVVGTYARSSVRRLGFPHELQPL